MAIRGYESAMPYLSENTRKEISGIIRDHKEHALEISDRITKLGGMPVESTGMAGAMSQIMLKAEGLVQDEKSMLTKLYDGEDQGIAAVEKVSEGDLDKTSMEMVQKMLRTDHDHLKKLQQLIN